MSEVNSGMNSADELTTLASWARAIRAALLQAQIDWEPLFADAGITPAALGDPEARIPLSHTTRLWDAVVVATGDDAFGLRVASHVNQTTFHALTVTTLVSDTLMDAMERTVRYSRVVTDAAGTALGQDANHCWMDLGHLPVDPPPAWQAIDAFAAIFVRTARALVGPDCLPVEARFARPRPQNLSAFEQVFRCPLQFSAPQTRIVFDRAKAALPLETANPALRAVNEALLDHMLRSRTRTDLVSQVRDAISRLLPGGACTQQAVADALHLSLRSLQRKLAERDTSFREQAEITRRELADRHLAAGQVSVTEVAYLVGFSDASSFTRAYKRWTGQAPSDVAGHRGGSQRS